MNKFISKPKEETVEIKEEKKEPKVVKKNYEVITKGKQTFKKCLGCQWIHSNDVKVCNFCGTKL